MGVAYTFCAVNNALETRGRQMTAKVFHHSVWDTTEAAIVEQFSTFLRRVANPLVYFYKLEISHAPILLVAWLVEGNIAS